MLLSAVPTKLGFTTAPAARRPARCRLQVEALEGRCVPAAHHPLLAHFPAAHLGAHHHAACHHHTRHAHGSIHILAGLTNDSSGESNQPGANGGEPGGNQGNNGGEPGGNQGNNGGEPGGNQGNGGCAGLPSGQPGWGDAPPVFVPPDNVGGTLPTL